MKKEVLKNILATIIFLLMFVGIYACGLMFYATCFYGHRMF